jgi:uncharacterized membrane protein
MHARRALPSLLLAFLMGASVLAVQPAQASTTPLQNAAVQGLYQDPAAPFMQWQPVAMSTTFYLHSDPTGSAVASGGSVPYTLGPEVTGAVMDAAEPETQADPPTTFADGLVPPTEVQSPLPVGPSSVGAGSAGQGNQALIGCQTYDASGCTRAGCNPIGVEGTPCTATSKNPVGAVRFPMAESLMPVSDIHIFSFSSRVWASCQRSNAAGPVIQDDPNAGAVSHFGILAKLIRQVKDGSGHWVDDPSVGSASGGDVGVVADALLEGQGLDVGIGVALPTLGTVDTYTGSAAVGNALDLTGKTLSPGQRLLVQYEVLDEVFGDVFCDLYYDASHADDRSRITLVTDAQRVAAFPADPAGHHQTGFPSSSLGGPLERRFAIEGLVATAWGPQPELLQQLQGVQANEHNHANVRIWDQDRQKFLYYVDDSDGDHGRYPREFDTQEIKLDSSRTDQLVPEPDIEQDIGHGILRRSFLFAYDTTLPDTKALEAQFYSFSDQWHIAAPAFTIGGKGFTFSLLPGETAVHPVNPGEPTEFGFVVRNNGTAEDTITVAASDPSGGWTARVLGGGHYVVKPGAIAVGTLEVVPPPSAAAGSEQGIGLTASSSFADVSDPPTLSVKANVTAALVRKVDILTDASTFQVFPGQTKGYSATVRNLGTARDSIVVVPSFPSNLPGWTVRTNPASMQIVAGGFAEIQVLVTAPASAPGGQAFPLGLSAVEVGNSAVSDRVDVTVQVLQNVALDVQLYKAGVERLLRDNAPPSCLNGVGGQDNPLELNANALCGADSGTPAGGTPGTPVVDTEFDRSAIFHIPVTNGGNADEQYRVTAVWDKSVDGTMDDNGCDGDAIGNGHGAPDGIPDGWRFAWQDVGKEPETDRNWTGVGAQDRTANDHEAGIYTLQNALTVPAHSTVDTYLQIGNTDLACEGDAPPLDTHVTATTSNASAMKVTFTSLRDPALSATVPAVVRVVAPGDFKGSRYEGTRGDVDVIPASGQPTLLATRLTDSARFDIIAVNTGNEKDTVQVTVSGSPGWTHRLVYVNGTNVPTTAGCRIEADATMASCSPLGVFDEAHLQVVATPGPTVAVGDRDIVKVAVSSGDSGVPRTLDLVARAAGTLAFSAHVLGNTTRAAAAGHPVSFPLEISNEGTADDSYRVTVTSVTDAAWKPVVSTSTPLFVPAGHDVPAFLTLTPPANTPPNTQALATIQVESTSALARQVLQVIAVSTPAGALTLAGSDGPDVLLSARGTPEGVTVVATKLQGAAGDKITFRVDRDSLPSDWTFDDGETDLDKVIEGKMAVTPGSSLPRATATFKVTAPAQALGTARALLHVEATTNTTLKAATDIALDLDSTQGIGLALADNRTQVIAPGGPALYNLTVRNLGLGEDAVTMRSSQLPAGWTLVINPASATLGPLQSLDAVAKLSAPVTAKPGDVATVVLFAASAADPGQVASQVLRAQVGYNAITLEALDGEPYGAPQETVTRVVNVTNTGTLPDQVQLRFAVDTVGVRTSVNATVTPLRVSLKPGETEQVSFSLLLGADIPSDSAVQATARAVSLLDARPEASRANASALLLYHVLPYATLDVNGDKVAEYAVDRDRDAGNGLEEFRASTIPGGRPLSEPDLSRFLRDDARAAFERDVTLANGTVRRVLLYAIDGDGDGKVDHLLDGDRDGQPDFYWDPDANRASPIEFRKDVNGDQVPESFVDTDGDGKLDATFDLTRGTFTKVLQTDVDGDGKLDYVVDKDGDGQVDQDETVLYTRTGGLLIVQKVDVDGDGKLDQVFDTNGDGNPDYFIPNGSTESVPITMRDVNGDGVMDWTFDGDNDGRKESYYDPATGQSHTIDAAGHFVDALKEYWYIGALFAVVVVLFVALVLVTRR